MTTSIFDNRIKIKNFEDILTEFSDFLKGDKPENLKIELSNELISYSIKREKIAKMYKFNIQTVQKYKRDYNRKKN